MSPLLLPPRPSIRRRRRRRLPRRRALYWVATTALAVLTGAAVSALLDAAAADVARHGQPTPAVVVTRSIEAGTELGPGDTEIRDLPAAVVPDGARRTSPEGRTATVDLHAGEVLLERRLSPEGLSPTAAMLPAGTLGVSVPTGAGALPLRRGDRVDVVATMEPAVSDEAGFGTGAPTITVARRAVVVATDDDGGSATIAVSASEAPRVAFALSAGAVTLLLAGPDA